MSDFRDTWMYVLGLDPGSDGGAHYVKALRHPNGVLEVVEEGRLEPPAPEPSRCTTCLSPHVAAETGGLCMACALEEASARRAREREGETIAAAIRHKPADWGKPS